MNRTRDVWASRRWPTTARCPSAGTTARCPSAGIQLSSVGGVDGVDRVHGLNDAQHVSAAWSRNLNQRTLDEIWSVCISGQASDDSNCQRWEPILSDRLQMQTDHPSRSHTPLIHPT
ncbi:hypothetical protein IAQ61_007738 [Plenodomus lingam]|uniref:uncharacterized protein n=1 Tax=Leptosphaeria maculans TaxID=5022 RepID=UPI0033191E86|nr:hypothetical protein IAQ61_007738 [Plenodomus lingam]